MELVRTKRNINLILKDFKEMEANEDHMSLPLLYLWKPIFQRSIFAGILVFTAQCKIFQITTPELVQVKIYLKLVQVNLPELFLHTLCTYFPCFWNFNVSARLVMSNSAHFLHFLFRSNSSHFLHFFPLKFRSFLAFFFRSNSAHSLHFLFRSNSAHFLHFFLSIPLIPVKFRSFRSSLAFFWAEFERTPRLGMYLNSHLIPTSPACQLTELSSNAIPIQFMPSWSGLLAKINYNI